MINSHSLHKCNIVFAFRNQNLIPPENGDLVGLYPGDSGKGAQLVDDQMMRAKILDVPKFGLQIAWEGQRLRIEDLRALEPDDSILMDEAIKAYEKLALHRGIQLEGLGFNFGIYYQNSDVIRINELFNGISNESLELGDGLLDFGWQWTLSRKGGKNIDGYFLKVTAPIEFVIHHNAHFNMHGVPNSNELKKIFKRSYEETHKTASALKLQ